MAEEAGFAVRWLHQHSSPGVASLARYLLWRDTNPPGWHDLCPISLGTAIMDAGRGIPQSLGRVRSPLMLAPFLARALPSGLQLSWDGVEMVLSEAGLVTDADREALLTDEAECSAIRRAARVAETAGRVPDSEADAIQVLERFAARTYAPATSASRAGAGAGTSDND